MLDGGGEYSPSKKKKKKGKSKNKRRFSDEQIKSLETIFEFESKLEPRKKLQVARELGLQPRQVAIWFQNRRARWKSKQLERDYWILQANYNALASQFETLKKEKQDLISQLQKLNDLTQNSRQEDQCCRQVAAENSIGEFAVLKTSLSLERSELGIGVLSDDDDDGSIKDEYFGLDEEVPELLLNMVEPADSSLTSPENWGSLDSVVVDGLLDQSGSSFQWSDFWS